jgi:uncharacterized protein (TIGR02246 family)
MAHQTVSLGRYGIAVLMAVTLAGCATPPAADPIAPVSTEADETAIRQVLADTQQRFNAGDLDAFMPVFASDAVIMAPSAPDVVGFEAIRTMYRDAFEQVAMQVNFSTDEIEVFGDLAYERGTYTLHVSDKASGEVIQEVENRHIHIFRRQADGSWKTWRMMVNVAEPTP